MSWIGVDFDGTLAEYHGWEGELTFGKPIPTMVQRVKNWLAARYEVKLMTARAFGEGGAINVEVVDALEHWMISHLGVVLPVTCSKDLHMIELWDDRCVQVVQNTGEPVPGQVSRVDLPLLPRGRYCARCRTFDDLKPDSDYCPYCLQLTPEDFAKPFSHRCLSISFGTRKIDG